MRHLLFRRILVSTILFSLFAIPRASFAACSECEEVAKGKIPAQFLDKSIKTLPSGIQIWDNEEALPALKDKKGKYLWVDTRPGSFLKIGTIKNAVNLVCDLKGVPIAPADKANAFSREKLEAEMKKISPDITQVTVIFFCQGPKCHRSYDAALRSVSEYGMAPSKIVWYRDGYPNLEKYILATPKLKKRISKYLMGSIVNQ